MCTLMAELERRVSIKKKSAAQYGRRIARISVRSGRQFVIHEDLLCARSPYFRRMLQPTRQFIEGDCSICHDELTFGQQELQFCAKCGGNFHFDCIAEWTNQRRTKTNPRCPLCRASWKCLVTEQSVHLDEGTSATLEMYFEWIYHGHISTGDEADQEDFDYNIFVEAYSLGITLEDKDFRVAVLHVFAEICQDTELFPGPSTICLAYEHTNRFSGLRRFLLDMFVQRAEVDWFRDISDNYPKEFVSDLVMAFVKGRRTDRAWDLVAFKAGLDAEEVEEVEEKKEEKEEDEEAAIDI